MTSQVRAHRAEVNWAPWSDVRWAGTPKRPIQCRMSASRQVAVSTFASGTASNILLALSMMVKRYLYPSFDTGSGPTMSTWMWEKRCCGTGMGCTAAAGCLVTLERAHCWQSATHSLMSRFMHVHTTRSFIILLVAFAPGCACSWKAANTWRRYPRGITGRGCFPLVSQRTRTSPKGTSCKVRLESWAAWEKILTSGDINGRPNLVARFLPPGPLSSKLSDGQVFDNGVNVVIGGIPAAPAVPAPVFDLADMLTVKGNFRTDGNLRATGNALVDGNASVNGATSTGSLSVNTDAVVNGNTTTNGLNVSANATVGGNTNTNALNVTNNATVSGNTLTNTLNVTNNAAVSGNVGIGKAPSTFGLDVAGSSNFDGRVKIGATSFPTATSYELAVGGGVIAEEVLVQLEGAWADYVFADNYKLKPLSEVENFIVQEKHLPGVISAKEVAENGLNLGEMQKAQMEKIEELYLHMIAMDKAMSALKAENEAMKTTIKQLKKRN